MQQQNKNVEADAQNPLGAFLAAIEAAAERGALRALEAIRGTTAPHYTSTNHPFGSGARSLKSAATRLGFPLVRLGRGQIAALKSEVDAALAKSSAVPATKADGEDPSFAEMTAPRRLRAVSGGRR